MGKKHTAPETGLTTASGLTLFTPDAGDYILFDDKSAYYLQLVERRPHYYHITLAEVDRESVFEADYMVITTELYQTVIYDVHGNAAQSATRDVLEAIGNAGVDRSTLVDFVFLLGGTALGRTPVSMCGTPMSQLH